jgi:hypothetical protein
MGLVYKYARAEDDLLPHHAPLSALANSTNMQRPASIPSYHVVNHLSKRSLLIAINCIAGLSIFFFGYDQ